MERRKFLKSGGLLAAAGFFSNGFEVIAGPFNKNDFNSSHFPADKKLDKGWLGRLYDRGKPTKYKKTSNELRYIGMPVGGICAGGVYVGGDGRLWLWDIFNKNQLGVITKVLPIELKSFNLKEINNLEGSLYLEPLTQQTPLQEGIAISITSNGRTDLRRLNEDDWPEVTFEATYPVAVITYKDPEFPLEVTVKAFSPFIPGNAKDSSLPATVQSVSVHNVSGDRLDIELIGWMENKLLLNSEKFNANFKRINSLAGTDYIKGVMLGCNLSDENLKEAPDYGNMYFGTLAKNATCFEDIYNSNEPAAYKVKDLVQQRVNSPVAGIISADTIKPANVSEFNFIYSWYVPNICFYCSEDGKPVKRQGMTVQGAESHYYTAHFNSAQNVASYLAENFGKLKEMTFLWKQTWYDSTLPWWFLERTFMNISTMATTTTHRFKSGRYYAWEGIGCCHGNCTHVYQYAHAVSRIFPEIERDTRERVDLGIGFDDTTGMIRIRGEKTGPSIDGQAGTVLRIYREHQMSPDNEFLKRNWPKIKKAVIFIIQQDKNKDGMEDTPMENTLDALWHGEISWIVGLCIAAVRAGQMMAEEMNEGGFVRLCTEYVEKGRSNMEKYLFNGEYFIHRPDPLIGKKEIGSFNTCHIDQVYGQSWAWQVNLGRVLDKEKTLSALKALWKYNYMPDVGPYIKKHPGGRFYALAGEGGMVMNTNPSNEPNPYGNAKAWQVGYFSECMSGFEYQVASHMMAEGMTDEAMVLVRTIHDRYHAFKRNPFNEIECSDHYGRAMASYGTFITASGFNYHGPKGHLGFSPKLKPANFRAPFTVSEGWGTYTQHRIFSSFSCELKMMHGLLKISRFTAALHKEHKPKKVLVQLDKKQIQSTFSLIENDCIIDFATWQEIQAGQKLKISII